MTEHLQKLLSYAGLIDIAWTQGGQGLAQEKAGNFLRHYKKADLLEAANYLASSERQRIRTIFLDIAKRK